MATRDPFRDLSDLLQEATGGVGEDPQPEHAHEHMGRTDNFAQPMKAAKYKDDEGEETDAHLEQLLCKPASKAGDPREESNF